MSQITDGSHRAAAARLRRLLSAWQDIELLVRVGEYREGQDQDVDDAVRLRSQLNEFLRQPVEQYCKFSQTLDELRQTVGTPC